MENFWKGKRVFLTGGSGFIGSHLLRRLCDEGAMVFATQHINQIEDKRAIPLMGFDISNPLDFLEWKINSQQNKEFDVVFHLAAYPIVTKAEENPDEAFTTNVIGTYNVLRLMEGIPLVVASTDKVYGRAEIPYTEGTPLLGTQQMYEATKTAADVLAQSFFYRGNKVAITRACNVIGYDKNETRLIPQLVRCGVRRSTFEVRSNPDYVRDYIYVEDLVDGYMALGRWRYLKSWHESQPVAFNFGGTARSVKGIISDISTKLGYPIPYHVTGNSKNEIAMQHLLSTNATNVLGWDAKYTLSEAISLTVDEYIEKEFNGEVQRWM